MNPMNLGSCRALFIDRLLIERLDITRLKPHAPVFGSVAIRIDKPWASPANAGMSVLDIGGRLWLYSRR